MTTPRATTTTIAPADLLSLVANKHRDGVVVLSTTHDCIFKLNGVGALTWAVIEQSPAALTLDELVEVLSTQFDNGELRADTERFVTELALKGLLQVQPDASGRVSYRVAEGTSATTSTTVGGASDNATPDASAKLATEAAAAASGIQPTAFETFSAFCALLGFDLLLRFRGFESFITTVESWPAVAPQTNDREICRRVGAIVTRAQVYYPKKAMCLQHSAVVTCLLRRRGVPAQMVLGAQEFPPKAHAWVEVAGTVVNDSQQVKTRYRELRRI